MKIVLVMLGTLVAVVLLVVVTGWSLPVRHCASRRPPGHGATARPVAPQSSRSMGEYRVAALTMEKLYETRSKAVAGDLPTIMPVGLPVLTTAVRARPPVSMITAFWPAALS